jgi:hypothetical protein
LAPSAHVRTRNRVVKPQYPHIIPPGLERLELRTSYIRSTCISLSHLTSSLRVLIIDRSIEHDNENGPLPFPFQPLAINLPPLSLFVIEHVTLNTSYLGSTNPFMIDMLLAACGPSLRTLRLGAETLNSRGHFPAFKASSIAPAQWPLLNHLCIDECSTMAINLWRPYSIGHPNLSLCTWTTTPNNITNSDIEGLLEWHHLPNAIQWLGSTQNIDDQKYPSWSALPPDTSTTKTTTATSITRVHGINVLTSSSLIPVGTVLPPRMCLLPPLMDQLSTASGVSSLSSSSQSSSSIPSLIIHHRLPPRPRDIIGMDGIRSAVWVRPPAAFIWPLQMETTSTTNANDVIEIDCQTDDGTNNNTTHDMKYGIEALTLRRQIMSSHVYTPLLRRGIWLLIAEVDRRVSPRQLAMAMAPYNRLYSDGQDDPPDHDTYEIQHQYHHDPPLMPFPENGFDLSKMMTLSRVSSDNCPFQERNGYTGHIDSNGQRAEGPSCLCQVELNIDAPLWPI